MTHNITLITGDGVGPELAEATRRVIDATGVDINWDVVEAGVDCMEKHGTPLPDNVLESIRKNKVAIKAPITTPLGSGFRSVNVALRKELDLYACVRPCKFYPGIKSQLKDPKAVDIVIIRENTEDLYAGIEYEKGSEDIEKIKSAIKETQDRQIKDDAGISIKPISVSGTERIVKFAYEYAQKNKRNKVTAVTKSNIMKFTDGLFMKTAEAVGENFNDVESDHILVDALCMQLVQKPQNFDVLVLPNLYGDIISDLGAGLVGGLGVAPGANIGNDYAVFEATHGSAPKYQGQNKVNPTAMILSGVMMLHYLGESDAANKLEDATAKVLEEGTDVTYDLSDNSVGTKEMADAIIKKLQ